MATRTQILDDIKGADDATLWLEWDDVTLAVNAIILNVTQGTRGVVVTVTRVADGLTRSNHYAAGSNVRWVPPIPLVVTPYTNLKTGQIIGTLPDYTIELAFD